jgi:y4mF family transcriptional regulator
MVPGFSTHISEFVRARRKAGGFSQQELAELAGVGRNFVSDLEQAKPTVRMDAVNKVLVVFGKTLGIVDAPKDESDENATSDS